MNWVNNMTEIPEKKMKQSKKQRRQGERQCQIKYIQKKLIRKQNKVKTTSLKPCRHQSCPWQHGSSITWFVFPFKCTFRDKGLFPIEFSRLFIESGEEGLGFSIIL